MRLRISLLTILALVFIVPLAQADDFSSTNFTLQDPVIAEPASYGTSSSYGLWGVIPSIAPTSGTSTNFGVNPGFLAFSNVEMPTLEATADVTELTLSWSAAVGGVAATYEPGYATTPGGPYTFAATQTDRTATISGLSASTAYYLIIRVKELSGGALLGYSNELAISTLVDPVQPSGSVAAASAVWVLTPEGLVPSGDENAPAGSLLQPGESVTITPPLFRQFGYVAVLEGGAAVALANAVVELSWFNPETNRFELWPSDESAMVRTDERGFYSFIVPPGQYRLRVSAPGYLEYVSPVTVIDSTGQLVQQIELVKKLDVSLSWPILVSVSLLAAAIAGLMVFVMMKLLLRR